MLKIGDPCYVRYQGKIIEVQYMWHAELFEKSHWVHRDSVGCLLATKSHLDADECRFVCMTGIKKR